MTVRLYLGLHAYRPGGRESAAMDLPDGSRLDALREALGMPGDLDCLMLVNGRPGDEKTGLADGDEVVMFKRADGG